MRGWGPHSHDVEHWSHNSLFSYSVAVHCAPHHYSCDRCSAGVQIRREMVKLKGSTAPWHLSSEMDVRTLSGDAARNRWTRALRFAFHRLVKSRCRLRRCISKSALVVDVESACRSRRTQSASSLRALHGLPGACESVFKCDSISSPQSARKARVRVK